MTEPGLPDWCDDGDPIGSECRLWLEEHLGVTSTDPDGVGAVRALDLPPGVPVAEAGRPSRCAHIIRWGEVEIRRAGGRPATNPSPVLVTLGAGDAVGDVPLLLGHRFTHDVVTASDVRLLSIDGLDLLRLLAGRSVVANRWVRLLAGRLVEVHQRLDEVLAGHLDVRLAAVLVRRSPSGGELRITQRQLAALLGVRRSSISATLARLERRSLIRRGYGRVDVVDPDGLRGLG